MDDIGIDDKPCPACHHPYTHRIDCAALGCDDGWIDRYEEDPLWYDEDDLEMCEECGGYGNLWWCPKCGYDMHQGAEEQPATNEP